MKCLVKWLLPPVDSLRHCFLSSPINFSLVEKIKFVSFECCKELIKKKLLNTESNNLATEVQYMQVTGALIIVFLLSQIIAVKIL